MALFGQRGRTGHSSRPGVGGFFAGLLGGREIEQRVDERFPTWEEFSEQKLRAAQEEREAAARIELPPHRVYLSSPLQGNFAYLLLIGAGLALGYASPELGPVLIYGAIGAAFAIALFVVFRDGLFLHIEALRLETDGDMINKHARGPEPEKEKSGGLLRNLYRKAKNRRVFRSKLLQIHYQNVLRTFEQGNRRTWVDQDASIADLQTLLSQRGMKLVWTVIEVLPLLGLLGTLIGLTRMFLAFRENVESPEVAILAGFGTALGTTILANLFVLVLRPLYMRNERSMQEILSTIQVLMAMFILPTQQTVLERSQPYAWGRTALPVPATAGFYPPQVSETRLAHSVDELARALSEFTEVQAALDSGAMARETAQVAQETAAVAEEVRGMLQSFQRSLDPVQLERQQRNFAQLTDGMQNLAHAISHAGTGTGTGGGGGDSSRIEHDLTQLRVLTHDTLLLLDQIAGQLGRLSGESRELLSNNRGLRTQVFGSGKGSRERAGGGESGEREPLGSLRVSKER